MSAIALLREGIINKDWHEVISGFQELTGENLAPPEETELPKAKAKRGRPKKTAKLEVTPRPPLLKGKPTTKPKAVTGDEGPNTVLAVKTEDGKYVRQRDFGKYQFKDDLSLVPPEPPSHLKMYPAAPAQRRGAFQMAKQTCVTCQKTVDVHPSLVRHGEGVEFRCDGCQAAMFKGMKP